MRTSIHFSATLLPDKDSPVESVSISLLLLPVMASVSSLDQDMRQLRLDRYTPQAAQELRSWIESTLGEQLPNGDVLDSLKDGVVLCKSVSPNSVRKARADNSAS